MECLLVAYFYNTNKFVDSLNATSEVRLGKWWKRSIMYVTPVVLGVILTARVVESAMHGYEGYPAWAILSGGYIPLGLLLVGAFALWRGCSDRT